MSGNRVHTLEVMSEIGCGQKIHLGLEYGKGLKTKPHQ